MMNASRKLSDRAGFSLIEVLISVTVLALALLGLAAVFPAVVKQQQRTSDAVQGDAVARSAIEAIGGYQSMAQPTPVGAFEITTDRGPGGVGVVVKEAVKDARLLRGWHTALAFGGGDTWSIYPGTDTSRGLQPSEFFGAWELPQRVESGDPTSWPFVMNAHNGDLWVGTYVATPPAGVSPDDQSWAGYTKIRASDRLFPKPLSAEGEPRYVWDVAARRVYAGKRTPLPASYITESMTRDAIEVAVFVRRVDSSIRLKGVSSLAEALARPEKLKGDRYVPVAQDANGEPTNDGRGADAGALPNYSGLWTVRFSLGTQTVAASGGGTSSTTRILTDRVYLPASLRSVTPVRDVTKFAAQVGQKFVGYSGVVHTVVKVVRKSDLDTTGGVPTVASLPDNAVAALFIEPPLSIDTTPTGGSLPTSFDAVMTAQVPAAVVVKRVYPKIGQDFKNVSGLTSGS